MRASLTRYGPGEEVARSSLMDERPVHRRRVEAAARRATRWIALGLERFHVELKQALPVEAICTLGAEVALLCWLSADRVVHGPWNIELARLRQHLMALGTLQLTQREMEAGARGAAAGWLVHELALGTSRSDLERAGTWALCSDALATRRSSYRRLELLFFLQQAGVGVEEGRWVERSWVEEIKAAQRSAEACLPEACEREIYELTHILFYVTEFGKQPSRLSTPVRARLNALINLLRLRCIQGNQIDLVGELLLARWCLSRRLDNSDMDAWDFLLKRQQADGGVRACRRDQVDDFIAFYHPSLVLAITALIQVYDSDAASGSATPLRQGSKGNTGGTPWVRA